MKNRLLLFYGAGSGMGKSTLSRRARASLEEEGIVTRYVAEEDVLRMDAFAPYVSAVIWVTDSILPCLDWLWTAGADRVEICR